MKTIGWITVCYFGLTTTLALADSAYPPPAGLYNPEQSVVPQSGDTPGRVTTAAEPTPPARGNPYEDYPAGNNLLAYSHGDANASHAPVPVTDRGHADQRQSPCTPGTTPEYSGAYNNYPPQDAAAPYGSYDSYGYPSPQPYSNYPAASGWEFVPDYPINQEYRYLAPGGYNQAYEYPAQSGYYRRYEQPYPPPTTNYYTPGYGRYPNNYQQSPGYPAQGLSTPIDAAPDTLPPQTQRPAAAATYQQPPGRAAAANAPRTQQQTFMANGKPAIFRPMNNDAIPAQPNAPAKNTQ